MNGVKILVLMSSTLLTFASQSDYVSLLHGIESVGHSDVQSVPGSIDALFTQHNKLRVSPLTGQENPRIDVEYDVALRTAKEKNMPAIINFRTEAAYERVVKKLASESSSNEFFRDYIHSVIVDAEDVTGSFMDALEDWKELALRPRVYTEMNNVFFRGGRGSFERLEDTAQMAAEYVIQLIDRKIYHPIKDKFVRQLSMTQEKLLEQTMNAFLDYTSSGHSFLFTQQSNVTFETMEDLAEKLVNAWNITRFSDKESAIRAFQIMTNMDAANILPNAKGSFIDDPKNEQPFNDKQAKSFRDAAVKYSQEHSMYLGEEWIITFE